MASLILGNRPSDGFKHQAKYIRSSKRASTSGYQYLEVSIHSKGFKSWPANSYNDDPIILDVKADSVRGHVNIERHIALICGKGMKLNVVEIGKDVVIGVSSIEGMFVDGMVFSLRAATSKLNVAFGPAQNVDFRKLKLGIVSESVRSDRAGDLPSHPNFTVKPIRYLGQSYKYNKRKGVFVGI